MASWGGRLRLPVGTTRTLTTCHTDSRAGAGPWRVKGGLAAAAAGFTTPAGRHIRPWGYIVVSSLGKLEIVGGLSFLSSPPVLAFVNELPKDLEKGRNGK